MAEPKCRCAREHRTPSMNDQQQFRCLVLGGSGSLGRVLCQALAAEGARVAFTYHTGTAAAAELLEKLPGGTALPLDVSSVVHVDRTVDQVAAEFGGIDALVQCTAICISPGDPVRPDSVQRLEDISESGWDQLMAVNVKGTFFACRRVVRYTRPNGGGNIVLTGSINAVKPLPSPVVYATSKAALIGMTQTMAKELGPHNIRVNLVAPGVMEEGVSQTLPEHLQQEYVKHCGLRRLAKVPEIASVVAWLARHNTYVTAQTILVDGAL